MRRFTFLIVVFLNFCSLGCAQDDAIHRVLEDLEYLASDELEGRASGTEGNKKARQFLVERFKEVGLQAFGGGYSIEFEIDSVKGIVGNKGYNIIGYHPGKRDESIVITAHYDHLGKRGEDIFNGSDDNASGVAALLFIASQLKRIDTDYTLVFAALDAEESGLLGAHAFIDNPPVKQREILINVNFDMISKNDRSELVACGTYHYPKLKSFLESAWDSSAVELLFGHDRPELGYDDWTFSSDHAPFHDKGIPFIYFGVEDHEDYHKPTDTYDRTDFDFYLEVTRSLKQIIEQLDKQDLTTISK